MNGLRFFRVSLVAIIVALACVPTISAQPRPEKPAAGSTCKIYSLADLGGDPELCKWIADTIPQVIEPESWRSINDKKNTLSYYAPTKVLVVYQTPAVQAQVDEFLQNLKKAAASSRPKHDPQVVQAQFNPPAPPQPSPLQYQGSYPVPMPPAQPKHLFHFIIRYEGAGIIDGNVVKFTKALTEEKKAESSRIEVVPAPPPVNQSLYSGPPLPGPSVFGPSEVGPMTPRWMPLVDAPPPAPPAGPVPPPPPPLPF